MGKSALNFNEQRVWEVLKGENFNKEIGTVEKKNKLSLKEITQRGFPHVRPAERANSRVRNGLRALVALGMAKLVERGTYQATAKKAPPAKPEKAPAKKAPAKKPTKAPAKKKAPAKPKAPKMEAAPVEAPVEAAA